MPKRVWKWGKNWVGVDGKGQKKLFKSREAAAKHARKYRSKSSSNKSKSKPKKKKRNVKQKIKRGARRLAGRRKKNSGGQKAISINILKTAATIAAVGSLGLPVYNAVRYGNYDRIPTNIVNALKKDWKIIIGLPLVAAIVGRAFGRFSPRVGIRKAISVKAF